MSKGSVFRLILVGALCLSFIYSSSASASTSQAQTGSSKGLAVKEFLLQKDITSVKVNFQGKSNSTFDIYFSSDSAQELSPQLTIKSSRYCWGFCSLSFVLPLSAPAGVISVHTRGTKDLLAMQVWDPYTFEALWLLYRSAPDGGMNLKWNRLLECSSLDFSGWESRPADRVILKQFYDRAKLVNGFLVGSIALAATVQEWRSVNRAGAVTHTVANRIISSISMATKPPSWFGYGYRNLLPAPSQISALSTVISINRVTDAQIEQMCNR